MPLTYVFTLCNERLNRFRRVLQTAVNGNLNILRQAAQAGVARFIMTSSVAAAVDVADPASIYKDCTITAEGIYSFSWLDKQVHCEMLSFSTQTGTLSQRNRVWMKALILYWPTKLRKLLPSKRCGNLQMHIQKLTLQPVSVSHNRISTALISSSPLTIQ